MKPTNEQIAALLAAQTWDERNKLAEHLRDAVVGLLEDLGADQFRTDADRDYFATLLAEWSEAELYDPAA